MLYANYSAEQTLAIYWRTPVYVDVSLAFSFSYTSARRPYMKPPRLSAVCHLTALAY